MRLSKSLHKKEMLIEIGLMSFDKVICFYLSSYFKTSVLFTFGSYNI